MNVAGGGGGGGGGGTGVFVGVAVAVAVAVMVCLLGRVWRLARAERGCWLQGERRSRFAEQASSLTQTQVSRQPGRAIRP